MGLDNMIVFLDWNGMQIDTKVTDVDLDYEGQVDLWKARGWNVIKSDGKDMADVVNAISVAKSEKTGKPTIIIAKTQKGAGLPGMSKHGSLPSEADVKAAMEIIGKDLSDLAGARFDADTYIKDTLEKISLRSERAIIAERCPDQLADTMRRLSPPIQMWRMFAL